ncbi:MAG: PIN domain-containing protein [Oscillospiraceae bacterium]|jgi:predicted nucleic acid-binding protein|nr:PIN domain-containing protein [Oscillospiraceae bacterium]
MSDLYILDACALIALIKKEAGWETVLDVLSEAITGTAAVFMHELNLLEIYYGFYKERGKEYAEEKVTEASSFFVTINGLTKAVFAEAGRLKAAYKISLADSVALAQASIQNGILLTADHHEFDAVEQAEDIKFLWIR